MKLTERILIARRKAGLSQEALAGCLGVKRSAVANWECADGSSPTMTNLIKLAKTTHMPIEWLATGRGPMQLAHDPLLDTAAVDADLIDDPQERRLVRAYRSASAKMRIALLEVVEEMAVLRNSRRSIKLPRPFFHDE